MDGTPRSTSIQIPPDTLLPDAGAESPPNNSPLTFAVSYEIIACAGQIMGHYQIRHSVMPAPVCGKDEAALRHRLYNVLIPSFVAAAISEKAALAETDAILREVLIYTPGIKRDTPEYVRTLAALKPCLSMK